MYTQAQGIVCKPNGFNRISPHSIQENRMGSPWGIVYHPQTTPLNLDFSLKSIHSEAKTVKALTLHQPWASLLVSGRKVFETRSWGTRHRGELAIHAGLTVDKEAYKRAGLDLGSLPTGCVLAILNLTDCFQSTAEWLRSVGVCHLQWGDFQPGRWIWQFGLDVRTFGNPVPAQGRQGLWSWKPAAIRGAGRR